jgi:hypothetical protein
MSALATRKDGELGHSVTPPSRAEVSGFAGTGNEENKVLLFHQTSYKNVEVKYGQSLSRWYPLSYMNPREKR